MGTLHSGRYDVSGVAAFAGHDDQGDLAGDLDVFRFELAHDSLVRFEL